MSEVIAEARAAWARIQDHGRRAWDDWRAIGAALEIGRNEALKITQANRPYGKKYTAAYGAWLRANGLDRVAPQVRSRLSQCMANIAEIEAWRESLPEDERARYGHPDSIWWRFNAVQRKVSRPVPRNYAKGTGMATSCRYHKSVSFSQDMIRRAATAMRERWSNDVYALAAIALSAAVRNVSDLAELLPPEPAAKPARIIHEVKTDGINLHA